MPIIQTALNYTRANATNFTESISIHLTNTTVTLLLEWGHFVPIGTQFVEVNACIGWEGTIGSEAVEFRFYRNSQLVASAVDNVDDIRINVDNVPGT
ncbi:hypothetical protein [Aneurinibacillus sp. REN35]|uniref:hypothetical protein n=1 Tax=Aneurinibacillus sp. REN35 TaxID=3237286 RepID=UPI0035299CDB